MEQVCWVSELRKEANDLVGKKCANLGEMHSMGLPVPDGFVLSVAANETFMEKTGIKNEIEKLICSACSDVEPTVDMMEDLSKKIGNMIMDRELPSELENRISKYYMNLCDNIGIDNVAVAVRSSGAISMPGQMETHLNIRGRKEVVEGIKKVWASGYTPRALFWRLRHEEMDVADARMGVAVIQMIRPRSAGVGFTANPSTGSRDKVMIEGNWGVGESIVQGIVTPDVFQVRKEPLSVESLSIGNKLKYYVLNESGVSLLDVPKEKQDVMCVDEKEAIALAKYGIALESHFRQAQDFEWVIDEHTDRPFIVQTRPARHLPPPKSSTDVILGLMKQRLC